MQKGFTLIELLVVMIIVSLLVVASVPKYKTAMEKARAQEGITDLTLAADQANGYYMMQNGSYANIKDFLAAGTDSAKQQHFEPLKVQPIYGTVILSIKSKKAGYTLSIMLSEGAVTRRSCIADSGNKQADRICDAIGWGR